MDPEAEARQNNRPPDPPRSPPPRPAPQRQPSVAPSATAVQSHATADESFDYFPDDDDDFMDPDLLRHLDEMEMENRPAPLAPAPVAPSGAPSAQTRARAQSNEPIARGSSVPTRHADKRPRHGAEDPIIEVLSSADEATFVSPKKPPRKTARRKPPPSGDVIEISD